MASVSFISGCFQQSITHKEDVAAGVIACAVIMTIATLAVIESASNDLLAGIMHGAGPNLMPAPRHACDCICHVRLFASAPELAAGAVCCAHACQPRCCVTHHLWRLRCFRRTSAS